LAKLNDLRSGLRNGSRFPSIKVYDAVHLESGEVLRMTGEF